MKKIRDVSFSWEGGRYFDLWMVVHTISGVFIGFILVFFVSNSFLAFLITFLILFFWEILERYFLNILEAKENRVIDIVIGLIGFSISFFWAKSLEHSSLVSLLIFSGVVLLILTLLGWLDFRRRGRERKT